MMDYNRYWHTPSTPIPYTKPSKFYFRIPEIKKINSIEQLNLDILPKLYTEVPILTALHSYDSSKIHYLPLPLKSQLGIKQFNRANYFIDKSDTYSYYIYKTNKETNHFIGGTSVLFDADYNLLFLITAKAVQVPLKYYNHVFFNFSHADFVGLSNNYDKTNFVFRDTTINVSTLLINKALDSKIYNKILVDLIYNADLKGWKFVIDKNLQEKWIKTPVAPKLEDIKTPLNYYIKKELNDIMNNIYAYD